MRPWRAVSFAAAVALGVAVAGCGGGARAADGSRVLVIGDSITAMSRDRLTATLDRDGWATTIDARGGTDIAFWRDRTADLARVVQPDVAVVELGTNQRGDEARVAPLVDAVMHDLRDVGTVLWLNVQEGKRFAGREVPPDAAAVNEVLAAAQLRWPNLHVLDFDGYFSDRPEWHGPDGLHPNRRGQAAIARFVAAALHDLSGSARG